VKKFRIRPTEGYPQGEIVSLVHCSTCLAGNPWHDPVERVLHVYLPPGYAQRKDHYPVLYDLAGYTSSGPAHLNWQGFRENLPRRLDRLIAEGRMGPVIVVFPDCFTALGGNQYIDSPALGAYATYLTAELIPLVDGNFRTLADRKSRALFGKSSGGYGALVHGMCYSACWGAIASHAGDVQFELVYKSGFPDTMNVLGAYQGDVLAFLRAFWRKTTVGGRDINALMTICMAASYDPDATTELGFSLPFDCHTGELDPQRWARWLRHDPLNLVEDHVQELKSLQGIYLDCGSRDQYHMHFGTRLLAQRLHELGVEHYYGEFDGTHSGIDYRLDESLPYLYDHLEH